MGAPQAFRDNSLPKKFFNKRNLRGCTSRKRDNIVLIEVDTDDFGDVIILDVPESFQKKFRKTPKHVISIDDDDDDGGESREGASHTNSEATTRNRCCPTEAAHPSTSVYVDKDCLFGNEGNTPVKLSKSKRTYSGKSISRNLYETPESEGCSSESDCSDCELIEGSSGKLHEKWEKAFYRRRNDASSVSSDFENKAGTSAPSHPVYDNAEEGTDEEDAEPLGQQSNVTNCSLHHERDNVFAGSPQKFYGECKTSEQECDPMEIDGHFTITRCHLVHDSAEEGTAEDPVPSGQQRNVRSCSPHHDVFSGSPQKFSNKVSEQDYDSMEMNGQFTSTRDDCVSSGFDEKESVTCASESAVNHIAEQSTVKNMKPVDDFSESSGKFTEHPPQNCNAKAINEVFNGDYSADETKGPSEGADSDHTALFDRQQGAGILTLQSHNKSSCGHENEVASSSVLNDIMIDRQKIKETEEYKHAMEEELAARQQQLMRQAEEARRLRNRKKAENMRLMINERRQKQRVEEIRQTRRQDEENLNLKEKFRSEIKKELHRIEVICGDMASLLRCLGIQVGGGPFPSPNEVQAAYKRACLKFHPDRISATDLRQQVEAEEKFKLISNMKEKFLSK